MGSPYAENDQMDRHSVKVTVLAVPKGVTKEVLQGNGNAQQLHSREGVMLRYQRVSC